MRQYIRNKSSGEIHNKYPTENCQLDQMADENKEVLSWAAVRVALREASEEKFCAFCWDEED